MDKKDWKKVQEEVDEINNIVSKSPENVQEKCFEMLFGLAFGNIDFNLPVEKGQEQEEVANEDAVTQSMSQGYKLPGNVLVMLRKNGLSEKDLEKLFMLDHEPILPIYKINSDQMAKAQVQKVFMILLENALSSGQFKADYIEVRETCREEGLFDSNFTTSLKNQHKFFKGAITEKKINEAGAVELSGQGYVKMAEIIRDLIQE